MTAGLWAGRQLLWTFGGSGIFQRLVNPTISSFGLMAESPADRKEASRKLAEAPPGRSVTTNLFKTAQRQGRIWLERFWGSNWELPWLEGASAWCQKDMITKM